MNIQDKLEEWKELCKLNFDGLSGEAYGLSVTELKVRTLGEIFFKTALEEQKEEIKKKCEEMKRPKQCKLLGYSCTTGCEQRNYNYNQALDDLIKTI